MLSISHDLRHDSKVSDLHRAPHNALSCCLFSLRGWFSSGVRGSIQSCTYIFTAVWLLMWYVFSAIFLLMFLVSTALKMSCIYSHSFPRICWSVICATPSATWGGGREMHFNNENFRKTSICSSGFGWVFNSSGLSSGAESIMVLSEKARGTSL